MRQILIVLSTVLVSACGGGEGGGDGPVLPLGVYECDSTQFMNGMVSPRPETAFMFGVTGPGRYRDYDGGRGRFEIVDGVLLMTSGPLQGGRYRQESETYFQPLDQAGETSGIRCIHNAAKDIDQPW